MASHSKYSRDGTHPGQYYSSHAPSSNSDSGHSFASPRGMGPPSMEYPSQIDFNSRVLPTPSISHSWDSSLSLSNGYGDVQPAYGSSNLSRTQSFPDENPARAPIQDPIQKWYSGNDGPWIPQAVIPDERPQTRHDIDRITLPYDYRQTNPLDNGSHQYGVPPSDSGYGTRRSIGTASVFGPDLAEREHPDQDCHSLAGHMGEFSPFQGIDVLHSHESRGNESWPPPNPIQVIVSDSSSSICPTCEKPVKTPSEMKKHELRHTKPFVCDIYGCPRKEGFSTSNDLERHIKSKHPDTITKSESIKLYRCQVPGCKSKDKPWPRLDNFRSHLKRVHSMKDDPQLDVLVQRSAYVEHPTLTTDKSKDQTSVPSNSHNPQSHMHFSPTKPSNLPSYQSNGHASWNDVYLDNRKPSNILVTSTGPSPEISKPPPSSVRTDVSPPRGHHKETIQPQEVHNEAVPTEPVTSTPVGLMDLVKSSERASPDFSKSAKKTTSGKKQGASAAATDATIAEVIRGVLAGTSFADSSDTPLSPIDAHHLKDAEALSGQKQKTGPGSVVLPAYQLTKRSDAIEDRSKKESSREVQTEKDLLALEVLKVLRERGYIIEKDPSIIATPKQNPGSVASNKSENQVVCNKCQRFRGRPCELKKHMKRHERPYGCTFPSCNKTFGSKNDWKRHENSQHFQLETWRCSESKPGGPSEEKGGSACAKVCYRRQTFKEHLTKDHQINDSDLLTQKAEKCRIGRNCQARFWCGFCVETVDLKKKGLDAWTERFNHIDDHFMGRSGRAETRIENWVPVDSDKPKGKESPQSLDSSTGEDHESSSPDSDSPPATAAAVQNNKKRTASDDESNQPRKQARKNTLIKSVTCCQCKLEHNAKVNDSCTLCEDGHRFCDSCPVSWKDTRNDRSQ